MNTFILEKRQLMIPLKKELKHGIVLQVYVYPSGVIYPMFSPSPEEKEAYLSEIPEVQDGQLTTIRKLQSRGWKLLPTKNWQEC